MSNVSEESRNPSFDRVDCYAGLKSQDLEVDRKISFSLILK